MIKKALIIVDVQNDFCKGGSLEVPGGEEVVPVANKLMDYFTIKIATQDWHPADHASFASNQPEKKIGDIILLNELPQVLWPDHCVQGSKGAEFREGLQMDKLTRVFQKGIRKQVDSYSGFFDNARQYSTGLEGYLQQEKITHLYVMGLATDYCVKFTVLDALSLGYHVFVIEDGCRGVNLSVGDAEAALKEMEKKGAKRIVSHDIVE